MGSFWKVCTKYHKNVRLKQAFSNLNILRYQMDFKLLAAQVNKSPCCAMKGILKDYGPTESQFNDLRSNMCEKEYVSKKLDCSWCKKTKGWFGRWKWTEGMDDWKKTYFHMEANSSSWEHSSCYCFSCKKLTISKLLWFNFQACWNWIKHYKQLRYSTLLLNLQQTDLYVRIERSD